MEIGQDFWDIHYAYLTRVLSILTSTHHTGQNLKLNDSEMKLKLQSFES